MNETNQEIQRFLVTDPCFIVMEEDYYVKIADRSNQWRPRPASPSYSTPRPNTPEPEPILPMNVRCKNTGDIITLYLISTTLNGFGSQIFREQELQVESGMICLAENKKGWNVKNGIFFDTLTEAKIAFPYIFKNS